MLDAALAPFPELPPSSKFQAQSSPTRVCYRVRANIPFDLPVNREAGRGKAAEMSGNLQSSVGCDDVHISRLRFSAARQSSSGLAVFRVEFCMGERAETIKECCHPRFTSNAASHNLGSSFMLQQEQDDK